MFYSFLKLFVGTVLRIYYPQTKVLGRENFKISGPVIVVSNHPNTLIDPLISAVRLKGSLYFLANSGLYVNRLATWIFDTFYCIKIERIQDTNGRPVKNDGAFKACDLHLKNGGNIFIAAEGTSIKGKKIIPFKTGTVRIALSAQQKIVDKKEVKILPVGINYRNPRRFGSSILVDVGSPISIRELENQVDEKGFEAIRKITKILEEKVKDRIIHCDNEEIEQYLDRYLATKPELNLLEWYQLGKEKAKELNDLKEKNIFNNSKDKDHPRGSNVHLGKSIYLGITFPIFLWGIFNHLIAAGVPYFLSKYFNKYEEYEPTFQILSGIIILPLFYIIQFQFVETFWGHEWAWIYLISLPISGYFSAYYYRVLQKFEREA